MIEFCLKFNLVDWGKKGKTQITYCAVYSIWTKIQSAAFPFLSRAITYNVESFQFHIPYFVKTPNPMSTQMGSHNSLE